MAHGDIFHTLFEAGELSAKEIAERTRRSKSTVSELVDRLVKRLCLQKNRSGRCQGREDLAHRKGCRI